MGTPEAIGYVIALPLECRSLTRRPVRRLSTLEIAPNHWIRVSGAGAANAEAAADELIARGVRRLISWGCAGALTDHLLPGDIVLAESVCGAEGHRHRFCERWRSRLEHRLAGHLSLHHGTIAHSTHVVDTAAAKRELGRSTGGVAVDMESAAVLRAAERRGLPCIAVRAVADRAATPMPQSVLHALDPHGEVQLGKLLPALARRPGDLPELLHLNRCFRAAIRSLARVAALTGPSLAA